MKRLIVILLLTTAALGVAGVWILTRFYDPVPGPHEAIELVPPDALAYVHVSLDPSNVQKKALRGIVSRFTDDGSFEETKDSVGRLLDPALSEFGLSYENDIDPWLGDELGLFVSPPFEGREEPEIALLLAAEDVAAARRTARTLGRHTGDGAGETESYRRVRYEVFRSTQPDDTVASAVLDGFLVLGSVEGVRDAIDASVAESLSNVDRYELVTDPLNDDHIVSIYLNTPGILEQVPIDDAAAEAVEAFRLRENAGIAAFSVRVEGDAAVLETAATVGDGVGRTLASSFDGDGPLEHLPADAWLALGVPDLEPPATSLLELVAGTEGEDFEGEFEAFTGLDLRADVLDWVEGGSLFLTGDSLPTLGGALVIGSTDPAATIEATARLTDRLEARFGLASSPVEIDGLQGFELRSQFSAPITFVGGDRLIVAYGGLAANAAVAPDDTLGDTESFRRAEAALGEGLDAVLFADLARIRELVDSTLPGPLRAAYERDVERFVAPLSYSVAGVEWRDEVLFQRLIVGVE